MCALGKIASDNDVIVVEDAAQAHGAAVSGRMAGSFGIGCFSFYATKNVTTGEGGVITTDDDAVAERARMLRNHGMRARYDYAMPGHNHRMTELQAAIGIAQLERLASFTQARRQNAELLAEGLRGLAGLVIPACAPGREHVWHQFTVRVTEDARLDRDDLARSMTAAGIDVGIYYPSAVFDFPCFRDHPQVQVADVPNARRAATEVLSLPVHPKLSEGDLAVIVETLRDLLG
jgi:dTDP-4-amino-4,6-dideoxygalactose transaminase